MSAANFSCTAVRSLSGSTWTMVTTCVFSRIISPAWTRRSETSPAKGARITASASFFFASSSEALRSCSPARTLLVLSTADW